MIVIRSFMSLCIVSHLDLSLMVVPQRSTHFYESGTGKWHVGSSVCMSEVG